MVVPTSSSSGRPRTASAWASVVFGLLSVAAIPAGIAYSNVSTRFELLHAGLLIPVAALLGIVALVLARRARRALEWTLERRGSGAARTGRILGALGFCLAITAAISVGFYALLVALQ